MIMWNDFPKQLCMCLNILVIDDQKLTFSHALLLLLGCKFKNVRRNIQKDTGKCNMK